MGIFNRAIPNIQTNNLNQVRVTPPEEYYVDDIFDPLFNAKVKEQLRAKYGNSFLGTIGGYMEGIDNALLGQDDKWGILGSGMGILSGFGRSMDKAGDFIIGGVTEGVKGLTGQGFENPLRNIFVEDEDYSGTRLLAAMGNSMAGLAKAPQLTEADFKGLWNIPAMGLELATDPGIMGNSMVKGAKSLDLAKQVSGQSANSNLANIGQILSEYDDFMAKVSMDLTAPGLRLGAKSLLDKIQQRLGNSSAKQMANVILNSKETPEARMQAQEALRNDSETASLLEMVDEIGKADEAIYQAELTKNVNTPDLNTAQAVVGMDTAVPTAIQEEVSKSKTEDFIDSINSVKSRETDLIREAYFKTVAERNAYLDKFITERDSVLDEFRKGILSDARNNARADRAALDYAKEAGLLNVHDASYRSNVSETTLASNFENYEKLQNSFQKINQMDDSELETYGIYPEYAQQLSLDDYDLEDITAGNFYDFTPNESARDAILRYAGIDPKGLKGLQLETPVTFSPSDYVGRSDNTLVQGLKASEIMLYNAFESAGISLRNVENPEALRKLLLDTTSSQGSKFKTAFPEPTLREHLVDELSILLFPQQAPKDIRTGAVEYLRRLNDFSNEIIAQNKARALSSTPLYNQLVEYADSTGVDVLDAIQALRKKLSFKDWILKYNYPNIYSRAPAGVDKGSYLNYYLNEIRKLESLYNISERPDILETLMEQPVSETGLRQVDLNTVYKDVLAYDNFWQNLISEYEIANNSLQKSLSDNLVETAEMFQRDIYNPIKNRASIGYRSSNLEFKDNASHAADLYGNRVHVEGTEPLTREDILNEKSSHGERVNDSIERKRIQEVYGIKSHTGSKPKISKNAYTSDKYKQNVKTDFGKRNIGYAGDEDSYEVHRTYNALFRIDPSSFKDVEKYTHLRDTTLREMAKHYQVKLKPNFFFKDIPSSTRIKDLDTSKLTDVSKLIVDEGREVVKTFNREVKPVAEALLKDGIYPWADPENVNVFGDQVKLDRVGENQAKMMDLLGYSDTPHPLYKEFRVIQKRLPIGGKPPKFKTPDPFVHYKYSNSITYDHFTIDDFVNIQNAKISSDWHKPIKSPDVRKAVSRSVFGIQSGLPDTFSKNYSKLKEYDSLFDEAEAQIEQASPQEAAEVITDFPTYSEAVETKLMEDLGIPEDLSKNDTPPDPPKTPSEPSKDSRKILYPKETVDLYDKLHEAVVASHRAYRGDKATLRTKYVKEILDDAALLMTKKGITEDAIAKYKRVQTYLDGAGVRKEEFLDTLASSGMLQMAFKPSQKFDKIYSRLQHNVAEVNVAMKSNVLKTFKHSLSNGNTVIGAMWDTSNEDILNVVEKNFKNVDVSKLQDIIRLDKGVASGEISKYIASEEYRMIDELFDKVRQQEGEYAKMLGFTYSTSRHIKNVRKITPDVGNYLSNVVYKDLPVSDLDNISDKMLALPVFKHLRGSWGTRKFDRRFIGYIEDFEADGLRIFEDDAYKIVSGSFAEGSFNNSHFQLYVDLFENDNFKISQYASKPEDLERILYAKLEDGTQSGNLQNLVLAAPRRDASGRVIGFTQFDKTTRLGLQQALNNSDTVLLPSHVFAPLDKILRKDAKMSNKVFAWVNKHLTLPFKFGTLMNPGFLLGNASDAFLKQITTMAHKYGTSVPEEIANFYTAMRDVMVLNNKFDDAYRRFLVHLQAEGFPLAPSNNISELAATDSRIRKMLKDYVSGKLKKSANSPIIECSLSRDERNTVKLWLMFNSPSASATFDKGFQDLDVVAQAINDSKYQMPKNIVDRVLTGKGQYVSTDISTWGVLANNPLSRGIMNISENMESFVRTTCILNDFRHKGMDDRWFKEYFDTLDELKKAAKSDPESLRFREELKKKFNVDMTEGINTMHNANFDYERMTDFTDTVSNFVPFPTFFLKNLGYWLDVLVNHPQYIDHAITVQESLWGSRDTSKDKFAAEAKGRGAIPISVGGQNLSNFFKGIYKPTPLQSMFGAFSLINNPVEDMYYRLHPALSGGITTASQIEPLKSITADVLPSDSVKYRPYSTDMYERNVTRDDPNFNPIAYSVHRANPLERSVQSAIRLPDKLKEGEVQLSDFLPSVFQPDFGEKYVQ